ncbi:GH92 family glycosyl hydrolase [Streptomyces beijiangensis]|uniref:GH92 family glycosyl hydrolase n=1 Tax=Streptomyces beijiangensis TaxID=163361 RepID=A0A939JCS0_9ACTN|nr:GH92 family glycosyl hydrolase [Streptomyces beijiangensis]MBO0511276.1 GH92 family glycosyl hydrolase [Streptomyces beijiangensis]
MSVASGAIAGAQLVADPSDYVDPLIGTGRGGSSVGEINNFPGPSTPFGMMQFSPDTPGSYAGYQYHSDTIRGFSMDHASVGCTAFGDVPILPVTGDIGDAPWNKVEHFSHTDEKAEPGYYAVTLDDSKVRAELTATTRTGLAAFTFPEGSEGGAPAQILVKGGASLAGDKAADMHIVGDRKVTGSATTGNFCGKGNEYTVHYAITFDQPFTAHGTWDGTTVTKGSDTVDAPKAGAYLTFDTATNRKVQAKISMSYVSVDGAEANQAAEVPGWSFEKLRQQTRDQWTQALRKIRVAGKDTDELKTFYTSLYHGLMHPNTFDDADGRYIGFDNKIRTLPKGRHQYANFSDWDTYRSLAPLQAMLWPKEASDMAQSLVNDAVQGGWWPRWPVANDYTGQMTGDNSVALISNLYAFGARDFDLKTALKYLVKGATTVDDTPGAYKERPDIANYVERGYAPNNDASRGDHARVGGSVTLEWAIDDFGIAQLAKAAGDDRTARTFTQRSQNWQNILNPATDYLQPRGEDGRFPDGPGYQPPAPGKFGQDGFDEGNAAQYNWLVPQNTAGLIQAMGGRDATSERLDTFFTKLNAGPNEPYMWAGNEVNFGVPWVYNHLGTPWKTQKAVRDIATTLFSPTPDGEPGNDDLGAQSSWYVWAALGVYPSTPGTPDLSVHSPLFERAVLDLPGGGRDLDIRAPQAAATAPYVHDLKLDGRDWERTYLPQSVVRNGGRLDFSLSGTPDTHWATSAQAAPPSYRTGEHSFLANATPNQSTVVPGGAGADITVDAQRLGGHDRSLTVTAQAPKGLELSARSRQLKLDARTGSGSTGLTVTAGPGTPEGYYEIPLTVRGSGGADPVKLSAYVLVAAEGSLSAAYDNTGTSDDADHGQGDYDAAGNTYSRQGLAAAGLKGGARLEASGTSFMWPAAPQGRPDNLVAGGQTIDLGAPAKDAKRLLFVGSATNGDHKGSATVTFTDGTTGTADLSFGDWTLPGGGTDPVFGNTLVGKAARNQGGGTGPTAYVFATTPFQVPDGKQIKSVTLPKDGELHVYSVGLG